MTDIDNQEILGALNEAIDDIGAGFSTSMLNSTRKEVIKKLGQLLQSTETLRNQIMDQVKELEGEVYSLAEEAAEKIMEATTERETANAQYEADAQQMVADKLKEYIDANKSGGEGMTREQLRENIANSMPEEPDLSNAIANAAIACEDIAQIDAEIGVINTIMTSAKKLDDKILNLADSYKRVSGRNYEFSNLQINEDRLIVGKETPAVDGEAMTASEAGAVSTVDAEAMAAGDVGAVPNEADVEQDGEIDIQSLSTHDAFAADFAQESEALKAELSTELDNIEANPEVIANINQAVMEQAESSADDIDEILAMLKEQEKQAEAAAQG